MDNNGNKHKLDDTDFDQSNSAKKLCLDESKIIVSGATKKDFEDEEISMEEEEKLLGLCSEATVIQSQEDSLNDQTVINKKNLQECSVSDVCNLKCIVDSSSHSKEPKTIEDSEENNKVTSQIISENIMETSLTHIVESEGFEKVAILNEKHDDESATNNLPTELNIANSDLSIATDTASILPITSNTIRSCVPSTKLDAADCSNDNTIIRKICDTDLQIPFISSENILSNVKEGGSSLPIKKIELSENQDEAVNINSCKEDKEPTSKCNVLSKPSVSEPTELDKSSSVISNEQIEPSVDSSEHNKTNTESSKPEVKSIESPKPLVQSVDFDHFSPISSDKNPVVLNAEMCKDIPEPTKCLAATSTEVVPCNIDIKNADDTVKTVAMLEATETKTDASNCQTDSKVGSKIITFSKCIPSDNAEESQSKIVSSKAKLDSMIDVNISKADDASLQSEATETAISSGLLENSDSVSGTFYSNDNSPSFSTPLESCQASAASSPKPFDGLLKLSDDQTSLNVASKQITSRTSHKKKSKQKSKKKLKSVSSPIVIDEETRMDAGTSSLAMEITGPDEDSQSSTGTSSKRESKKFRTEVIVPDSTEAFTVGRVIEYIWPLDDFGEHYFIQEHISRYLGIMSFKRKYPQIRRRFIEKTEKEYLKERGIVNEMACDLGLTAARSEDVMDIIFNDFPEKYEELHKDLTDRKERKFKEEGRANYQVTSLDKSKMQEYSKKAAADAARWNLAFNRERCDERRYCFDLQNFTMHRQLGKSPVLSAQETKLGSYPLAVLPGQYTDYYRKYSSAELKALPVHSVLSGPFTLEELNPVVKEECEEETAPEKKPVIKEILETVDNVIPTISDPMSAGKQPRCKECNGGRDRNKVGKPEPLIICGSCRTPSHPTCIELTLAMVGKIESYGWQCMECKTCAHCNDPNDEERMIFCDMCDRGYHIYCVGLRKVPNGRWHCRNCASCYSCKTRVPAGNEVVKAPEWQHEFKKNKDTKEINYVCTLCMTCDRYWKRRMYCNSCWKVYKNVQEAGMVKCAACPKYIHREGCSTLLDNENLCNYCVKSRKNTAMNHSRILAAAKKKMAAGY